MGFVFFLGGQNKMNVMCIYFICYHEALKCFLLELNNSATFSCMFLFSASQNTVSTHTHKQKAAPAPQAMIDSIKSNSVTVAHFKVNLSQHFDIFKNKARQIYFRSSFELLPQLKKKENKCPFDQTISVQIRAKRALRIPALSKTSPKSI